MTKGIIIFPLLACMLATCVNGHGQLVLPVPRGHENGEFYESNPSWEGNPVFPSSDFVCRGRPNPASAPALDSNVITAGQNLAVRFNQFDGPSDPTYSHPGDCALYISYDVDKPVEDMGFFLVKAWPYCTDFRNRVLQVPMPTWLPNSNHVVLRWEWTTTHLYPTIQMFNQCADVRIQGGREQGSPLPTTFKIGGPDHVYRDGLDYCDPFVGPGYDGSNCRGVENLSTPKMATDPGPVSPTSVSPTLSPTNAPPTSSPTSAQPMSSPTSAPPSDAACESVWNVPATDSAGTWTCGQRITWLQSSDGGSLGEAPAKNQVADEFPILCGACATNTLSTCQSVWDAPATDSYGTWTCGQRITWLQSSDGGNLGESSAKDQVADEFPIVCGACATNILPTCQSVWDAPATDSGGTWTCGQRITWLQSSDGGSLNESYAKDLVADEFPNICGPCAQSRYLRAI